MKKLIYFIPILILMCFPAHGGGFQISEQSISGLGRAFAGEAAIADNAAVAVRNPAAMTRFKNNAVSGGFSFIAPMVETNLISSELNISNPPTSTGSENYSKVISSAIIPNFHYIHPMEHELVLGFSAFSNFGLASQYPDYAIAGPSAGESELTTIDFNVNLAYPISPQWQIGGGLSLIYGDASLKRTAGSLTPVLQSAGLTVPNNTTEISYMKGHGWAIGWNLGLMWNLNEKNRFGLSYRSASDLTLKGDYRGTSNPATLTNQSTVDGELVLNLPDIMEFSGLHHLNDHWSIHYSAMYVGWDVFKELRGTGAECTSSNGGASVCLLKEKNWKNVWRYAIGASYHYSSEITLRTGFALDNTPIPNDYRTMSIPDTDRHWYSFGATYNASKNLSLDAGVSILHGKKAYGSETENVAIYHFDVSGNAYIVGVGLNFFY